MARLYLFAEGKTEETFADVLLKPHLAGHGVYLHGIVQVAHARKRGKVHRGGGRYYEPMRNDIRRFLAQEKAADVYFTTMIDLYAIHAGFPGLEESDNLRHDSLARVEALERAFADDIGDPRFVPYIQLHEFEAILFCDPGNFRLHYENCDRQVERLRAIADDHDSPERIDDGPQTAPSKRIIAEFPSYEAAKPVVGPEVAQLIGLKTIREKCPHFASWLSRLEGLPS